MSDQFRGVLHAIILLSALVILSMLIVVASVAVMMQQPQSTEQVVAAWVTGTLVTFAATFCAGGYLLWRHHSYMRRLQPARKRKPPYQR